MLQINTCNYTYSVEESNVATPTSRATGATRPTGASVVEPLGRAAEDHSEGRFDKVTDVVRDLSGKPPRTPRGFVRENIAQLAA